MRTASAATGGAALASSTVRVMCRSRPRGHVVGGRAQQRERVLALQPQRFRAVFQAGEHQEMLDQTQQALGVVARVQQQLRLLGRERADALLQQQVHRQAQAGQRRLQLVAGGGHEVRLKLVEQAEAGYVAEDHGGPERVAVRIADGSDLRQVGPVLAVEAEEEHLVERLRQVGPLFAQRLGQRLAQRLRREPGRPGVLRPHRASIRRGRAARQGWPARRAPPGRRPGSGRGTSRWSPGRSAGRGGAVVSWNGGSAAAARSWR